VKGHLLFGSLGKRFTLIIGKMFVQAIENITGDPIVRRAGAGHRVNLAINISVGESYKK
jgi:hypothetical protein